MAILRPLKPREIKAAINTADIETANNGELLDIGLFMGGTGQYCTYSNWAAFLGDIAELLPDKSVIWFHNGGKFDLVNLLYYISVQKVYGLKVDKAAACMMVGGRILQMKIFMDNGNTIIFRDSLALLPKGLDALTKTFCNTTFKQHIPPRYKSRMEVYKKLYPCHYKKYLNHDVLSLYEVLIKFRDYINAISPVGDLPVSIASLAMKVYLTSFLEYEINIPGERENELTRASYRGGRCEAVGDGQLTAVQIDGVNYNFFGDVTGIDVNSMYPYPMSKDEYPVSEGLRVDEFIYNDDGTIASGIYYVEYEQISGRYPCILGADPDTNKLQCSMTGEGWLTHIECNALLKYDAELHCYDGLYYEETAPIFQKFVNHFYSLRMAAMKMGDIAMIEICKLLLNNLYGKFAQRKETEEVLIMSVDAAMEWEPPKGTDSTITLYAELSPDYSAWIVAGESAIHTRTAIPVISSFVTAAARCHLHSLMERIGGVLYCDTDSIFTQNTIPDDLLDPFELGKSKIEYQNCFMDVRGRKMYALYNEDLEAIKKRSKGVSGDSVPAFMLDGFAGINNRPLAPKSFLTNATLNPSEFRKTTRNITRQSTTFNNAGV